jgi:hypothetical protein
MMKAVSTSEMSFNFYETIWCNIPEESSESVDVMEFQETDAYSNLGCTGVVYKT